MTAIESTGVCVVGAGQAAADLVGGLRQEGYGGHITLIGDEPFLPYQRPPLSKASLVGTLDPETLLLRKADFYARNDARTWIGTRVQSLHLADRRIETADGRLLAFETLVLATGGRARPLPVPGADAAALCDNWHVLRGIEDLQRLKSNWRAGARIAIVGGGYIGLEVAASAIKQGLQPIVLEGLPRVLARVTAPEVSVFYEREHRAAGVDLRTGVAVTGVELAAGRVVALQTSQGPVSADLFLVGIGLVPNTELAQQAGLAVGNGILVDENLRTAAPDVYAMGDCAAHPSVWTGQITRIESVPNASEQARTVAAGIVGKPRRYDAVPWFWSDQYDLKLQMVGLSQGYDRVIVRGQPDSRSFIALYQRQGVVIAADAVSRPAEFMQARKLVAGRVSADPGRLADESLPLKELLAASSAAASAP
jgi:3-phenylpropionate/trans-cinnamate dioxygenase ferredoxin reductase subunit